MVYKARLLLSGRQKVATALLLLLVIAFFSYYPRITEAILAFLLGGEVPGTNIVVSPDVVLAVVGVLFAFTIGIVAVKWHYGSVRRNHTFTQIPVKTLGKVAIPVITEVAEDFNVSVKRGHGPLQRRHRISAGMGIIFNAIGHATSVMGIASMKVARKLQAISVRVWKATTHGGFVTGVTIFKGIKKLAQFIALVVTTISILIFRSVRSFWRYAKPHLHALDAWLEIQVRKIEAKASNKLQSHESVRTVKAMGKEYRKSIHELRPKAVMHSTRSKVTQIKTKIITNPER
jgi:hypothetical protein